MNITAKTIHMMGDIHNEVELVNTYIDEHHPDVLVLLGDVALFWYERKVFPDPNEFSGLGERPVLNSYGFSHIEPKDTKVFWLMGNHECFPHVEKTYGRNGREPVEMAPNLYYCPTGSILNINGKNCMFAGGALSIDQDFRREGYTWFPEELLTDHDLQYMKESAQDKTIDIMFTHTCPLGFPIKAPHDTFDLKFNDPTRLILREIADVVKPRYWFFGHWHISKGGMDLNIIWQGVNTASPGWESGGQSAYDISGIFEKDV